MTKSDQASNKKLKLEQYLGVILRRKRLKQNLKIADVAEISLDTLQRLCEALGMSFSELFKDFDHPEGTAQHVKAGQDHEIIRRGTERGHDYRLLAYPQGPRKPSNLSWSR